MNSKKISHSPATLQLIMQAIKTMEEDKIQDILVLTMTHLIDLELHLHIKETMNMVIVHLEAKHMLEDFVNHLHSTNLQHIIRNLDNIIRDTLIRLIMVLGLHILLTMKEIRGIQIRQTMKLRFN